MCFLSPWIAPLSPAGWGKLSEPKRLKSPFQGPDAGMYPGTSVGFEWAGSHPAAGSGHCTPSYLDLTSKWLCFPTEEGFYCVFFKGKRETKHVCTHTHAQKCRGGEWAKGEPGLGLFVYANFK